jgi:hypothetical protein
MVGVGVCASVCARAHVLTRVHLRALDLLLVSMCTIPCVYPFWCSPCNTLVWCSPTANQPLFSMPLVMYHMLCLQFWRAVVLDLPPTHNLPLDLLSIPAWVLIGMLDSGMSPAMKDRSGYCSLFEDILSG